MTNFDGKLGSIDALDLVQEGTLKKLALIPMRHCSIRKIGGEEVEVREIERVKRKVNDGGAFIVMSHDRGR